MKGTARTPRLDVFLCDRRIVRSLLAAAGAETIGQKQEAQVQSLPCSLRKPQLRKPGSVPIFSWSSPSIPLKPATLSQSAHQVNQRFREVNQRAFLIRVIPLDLLVPLKPGGLAFGQLHSALHNSRRYLILW